MNWIALYFPRSLNSNQITDISPQVIPILSVQWKKPQINVTEYQKDNRIRIQKTTTNKTTTQNQHNTKCAGRHFAQRNTTILIQKAYSDKAMVRTQNEDNAHTSVMQKQ
jgi:hypothetical protein